MSISLSVTTILTVVNATDIQSGTEFNTNKEVVFIETKEDIERVEPTKKSVVDEDGIEHVSYNAPSLIDKNGTYILPSMIGGTPSKAPELVYAQPAPYEYLPKDHTGEELTPTTDEELAPPAGEELAPPTGEELTPTTDEELTSQTGEELAQPTGETLTSPTDYDDSNEYFAYNWNATTDYVYSKYKVHQGDGIYCISDTPFTVDLYDANTNEYMYSYVAGKSSSGSYYLSIVPPNDYYFVINNTSEQPASGTYYSIMHSKS